MRHRDLERSVRFYQQAFGLKEVFRHEVERAGGRLLSREALAGGPTAFVADPDGYKIPI